jgi:hypothetical protein
MIRRSTWLALLVLLALVGLTIYVRDRRARELAAATPTQDLAPLFGGSKTDPTRIRLQATGGAEVEFSRGPDGKWVLRSPEETQADQAAAQAAATQVGALRVLATVNLAGDIVGLDDPTHTLSVVFGDGSSHTLRIGSATPINDGYYTQLDDGPYQVVDRYGLDKLLELLQSPPYLATPTAEASATSVATGSPPVEVVTPSEGELSGTSAPEEQATLTSSP